MINTYLFTHILDSKEHILECNAESFEQAVRRLSKVVDGDVHYHSWDPGTTPKIDIREISHADDPICKDYPYQTVSV